MRLTISRPGQANVEHTGKLAELTNIVKADLRDNEKVTPQVLKGQLTRLGRAVQGVRGTTLVDNDFNLKVGYRITRN